MHWVPVRASIALQVQKKMLGKKGNRIQGRKWLSHQDFLQLFWVSSIHYIQISTQLLTRVKSGTQVFHQPRKIFIPYLFFTPSHRKSIGLIGSLKSSTWTLQVASLLEMREVLSKYPTRLSKSLYLNPEDKPDRKVLTGLSGSRCPFFFSLLLLLLEESLRDKRSDSACEAES